MLCLHAVIANEADGNRLEERLAKVVFEFKHLAIVIPAGQQRRDAEETRVRHAEQRHDDLADQAL